ncbi:MAG: acyltransferase family protein [Rhizomicrobium sp.]
MNAAGHRFHALDGLRGICAIVVLLYHALRYAPGTPFAHGYLSVDMFFILSGFVLAFAFGDRLAAGMSPLTFVKARIRRLGPIVLFGSILGAIGIVVEIWFGYLPDLPLYAVILLAANLLLIPFIGIGHNNAFPINGPMWSLFAELWVNVGFAWIARRLSLSMLIAIIVIGWTFIILHTLETGACDFGASRQTVLYAIPRAIPSFACGVLIFRLLRAGALARVPSINPFWVFGVWAGLSLMPISRLNAVYDIALVVIAAPITIALLARSESITPQWVRWLGKISYPLYATHAVIIFTAQHLTLAYGRVPLWIEIAPPILSVALAAGLNRWYEPAIAGLFRHSASKVAPAFP